MIPPNPLPGDGYLLRETPAGWEDEERAAYAGDSQDKPLKVDPIAALDVGTNGSGWALGGWSGEADDAGRGSDANGDPARRSAKTCRRRACTATRLKATRRPRPVRTAAPIPMQSGVATFAVGGHADCVEPCSALADEGIAPDRNLSAALGEIAGLSAQPNGPRMLLYTGGRETPGEGSEPPAEADRYAQLMSGGGSLPVYPALSAGDSEGDEDSAFGAAFAGFDAPFGEGAHAGGGEHREHPAADGRGRGPGRVPTTPSTAPAPPARCA